MKGFFRVQTPDELFTKFGRFKPVSVEKVGIEESLGRVLAEEIVSPIPLPEFPRSTVDGFGVKARDTYGVSDGNPALLRVVGEIPMGKVSDIEVGDGEAVKVATGGMVPKGANAVEMVEYVEPVDSDHIHAFKALAPLENTVQVGEDVKAGDLVLHAGQKIRPQDVGFMAGVGISAVPVFLRPKIAVISSGDEIIPVEQTTRPGEIRDINRYTISAMVRETGAIPLFVGIARDRFEQIREKVETGLKKSDMVVITGGSSVGTLDLTIDVLRSLPDTEILAHGVSVRPGKPTLLADVAGKPFLGLPGHPVSAMVIFHLFGKPIMEILAGLSRTKEDFGKKLKARASRNIPSGPGREDYIRVKLEQRNGTLWAHPVYGKSGAISSLVYAAGLMKIGVNEEGIEEGEEAEVILL